MSTLPTLREKKRYIAFEITSEQIINRSELSREILSSICSLFGDKGSSEINAGLISYDGRYGIIRCAKDQTESTRAALACIYKIRGIRISILVLGVSGTIKEAMEKFIQKLLNKESRPRIEN